MPSTLLSVITHLHLETAKWTHLFIICFFFLDFYYLRRVYDSLIFIIYACITIALLDSAGCSWMAYPTAISQMGSLILVVRGGRGKHQICGYGKKQQSSCK
jgi:hypothetical protein